MFGDAMFLHESMEKGAPVKPILLAVVGPTASGKTSLSIALAKALGGEIVSCDSMQVYRGMDIGTAKPDEKEREGIPHHLIDVVSPDMPFSCADYAVLARKAVGEILSRGRLPIFCGGTGLYLDAVLTGNVFAPDVPEETVLRVRAMSADERYRLLSETDPESAAAIHPNNEKRVARALTVTLGTGVPKSEWDRRSRLAPKPYDALILGLDYRDRQILYERIDRRVELMLENGLAEEAKRLDLDRSATAGQAIGYKELYLWLDGTLSYGEAVAKLKQNTRNYAKRQLTWFRRDPSVRWLYPDTMTGEELIAAALEAVKTKKEE